MAFGVSSARNRACAVYFGYPGRRHQSSGPCPVAQPSVLASDLMSTALVTDSTLNSTINLLPSAFRVASSGVRTFCFPAGAAFTSTAAPLSALGTRFGLGGEIGLSFGLSFLSAAPSAG